MEENSNIPAEIEEVEQGRSARGLWVAVIVLLCLAAVSAGYVIEQHRAANQLVTRNQELTSSLNQTQGQVATLASKLNEMQAAEEARAKAAEAPRHPTVYHHARKAQPVVKKDDPRWKQVESELAAHQQAINSTQQDIAQTRSDLQGNLSATRDELNGSIARTHDELVTLEKKGERSYYEFDLNKSKRFQRVGPIDVSLRKTNAKHQFADLQLLVDDKQLTKKHVNIYEPVAFYTDQASQSVQLVINQISKNHMHGYVSAPKYSASQLAPATSSSNPMGPAPAATTVGTLQRRSETETLK